MSTTATTLSTQEARRWTRIGLLAACSLLLSYAETFVPIPLPGVKLGLANIPVLVALGFSDVTGACSIALIKVLAVGLLFGSPLTMGYSLAGTALSLLGMVPLSRLRTLRMEMLSVAGALLHEMGQLLVAGALLGVTVACYASPYLLLAGCVTGALCGVLARELLRSFPQETDMPCMEFHAPEPRRPSGASLFAFAAFVAFVGVVFHVSDLRWLALCVAASLLTFLAAGVGVRSLLRMVPPLALVGVATLLLQHVAGTSDALIQTARAMARLATMALLARACMRRVPAKDLGGTVAWLVLPLTRMGVRTQGFLLALDVAVRLMPEASAIVQAELGRKDRRLTPSELCKLLPTLVRRLCEVGA